MKKKKPVFRDEKYDKFDMPNACSSTECTGLITVPPEDEDQLENYMNVYDFGPPPTK